MITHNHKHKEIINYSKGKKGKIKPFNKNTIAQLEKMVKALKEK